MEKIIYLKGNCIVNSTISIDESFSTTRLLTKEKPTIVSGKDDKLDSFLFLPTGEGRVGEGGLRTKGYFKRSYEGKALITVITVVFNGEKYLEKTIQSIINQDYDNVEYVIIDGGSTDSTIAIIKQYENQIDYWVSELDGGIYDAMNKGISLATGEYIAFMNADDWFENNIIKLIVQKSLHLKPDYIFGDLYRISSINGNIEIHKGNIETYKKYTPIGHQALFVKKEILRQIPFNTKYRIMADYDMMIKLINLKLPYCYMDMPVANFRLGGISTVDNYKDIERFKIQYENFGLIATVLGYIKGTRQPIIYAITSNLLKLKRKYGK